MVDNKLQRPATILQRDYTDVLRGISMVLIMITNAWEPFSSFPRVLNLVGAVCVAVFLFLSGYGLSESYKQNGLAGFVGRKFSRIVLPYWIWLAFTMPFRDFNATELLRNFFFIPSSDTYLYFIVYLIYCYLAFLVAHRFFPRHSIIVLVVFSGISLFMPSLMAAKSFSFVAGCLVSRHSARIESIIRSGRLARYVIAATVIAIVAYALMKALQPVQDYEGTPAFNLILSVSLLLFTPAFMAMPALIPALERIRISATAGVMSLELYMVHSAFVPHIASLADVVVYCAASIIIATVFHRFNRSWLKSGGGDSIRLLSILLYAAICYILALKYAMRLTPHFGYIAVGYLVLIYPVVQTARRICERHAFRRYALPLMLTAYCAALVAVQYQFDPYELQVDRWSAIHNVIGAMMHGDFPYLAQTHLDGYASPFPVWMVVHIPFYLLDNVGLSIVAATAVFVVTLRHCHGTKSALLAMLMLALSINMWYETSVRSDLITNFLLLAAFIVYIHSKGISFATHPWAMAVICGLWVSTRLTCALPLFIVLFPSWLRIMWSKRIIIPIVVLLTFVLTFLPLLLWDAEALLFAEYPPFVLQADHSYPADALLTVVLCILLALWHRSDIRRLMFGQSAVFIATAGVSLIHSMVLSDDWELFFGPKYDITYFDMALPFLIAAASVGCGAAKASADGAAN